jgi:hypothetical protein
MTTDSIHYQWCGGCGARYEVIVTKKVDAQDERVVCECGWPLKDWIGIKAYTFKRIRTSLPHQESEKHAQQ